MASKQLLIFVCAFACLLLSLSTRAGDEADEAALPSDLGDEDNEMRDRSQDPLDVQLPLLRTRQFSKQKKVVAETM
jgi:hypothetical protein